jgi:Na+/H+-dicarboxylate symporter
MVLQQVGLPVEGIGLIIGVDRLLDMLRTVVNVSGDGMVTAVVANSEGRLDKTIFNDTSEVENTPVSSLKPIRSSVEGLTSSLSHGTMTTW